jgi:insecticidal toxin complex protein TccC
VTGRPEAQRDPRLFALARRGPATPANLRTITSLSGQLLSQTSCDAGTKTTLFGIAGEVRMTWDTRDVLRRVMYDSQVRPVAVHEQMSSEGGESCLERFTYGSADPDERNHNRCGRMIRHDDPAGTRSVLEYGMVGSPLKIIRRFLVTLDPPDWPEIVAARDAMLEVDAYPTAWTHDALGVPTGQTDARGNEQLYGYTVAGQLAKTTLVQHDKDPQVLLDAIRYDAQGQVVAQTSGNGMISTYEYDATDGRLRLGVVRKEGGTILQRLNYAYDPVGNVIRIEDQALRRRYFKQQRIDPVSTFRYDTLYQLIEATGRESAGSVIGPSLPDRAPLPGGTDDSVLGNYTQLYTYDAGGNLMQLQHRRVDQPYTRTMLVATHSNRSLFWKEGAPMPDIAAGFDANGNQRRLEGQPMHWNARNQLARVAQVVRRNAVDDDEVYVYDGGGQRVRKLHTTLARAVIHQAQVRYLPGLEVRTDSAGEALDVITMTLGHGSVRCLHWKARPPRGIANDQLRYQVSDHLGSSTLELDQKAQLITRESYYPYGGTACWAARSAVEADYKTHRYSGKERDATGLYYYGYRYFAPWVQRWTNPDPAGAVDGLNLFRALRNNPLSYVDPDGHAPEIPKIAHYVWLGGNLPDYARSNVISYAMDNPDWSVNLWTDNPGKLTNYLIEQGLSKDAFLHFHVWDVNQAIESVPAHLKRDFSDVYTREISGPYRNYAAASDLLRLAILYRWGGLYMDTDVFVKPGEPIGRIQAMEPPSAHVLFTGDGRGRANRGNHVIASQSRATGMLAMLSRAVDSYMGDLSDLKAGKYFKLAQDIESFRAEVESQSGSNDLVWEKKRSFEFEGVGRRMLTLSMTGPDIVREFMYFVGEGHLKHTIAGEDKFGWEAEMRPPGKIRGWVPGARSVGDWLNPAERPRRASIA